MDEYNIYNRFYKKNSTVFFELLKNNKVETVLDIRLNNNSQLAGFSKYPDIEFFLNEICNINYSNFPHQKWDSHIEKSIL